ncbi:tail fiber assembly protein [Marinomonas shanghaiensis]|uniref:tail fiber assembly protein n=1 Tax=Marinomonas shanghaiensis TaxID=2202418 RepID=UPI003A9105B5
MFAVVSKSGDFTGVVYPLLSVNVVAHHEKMGDTFALVERDIVDTAAVPPQLIDAEYDESGALISPEEPKFLYVSADFGSPTVDELWDYIRFHRDQLIAETDWTQVADVQLSDEKKKVWADYRQGLRDLPQQYENPSDVVWPTKPE